MYVEETKRNVEIRWAKHEAVKETSEPAKCPECLEEEKDIENVLE